jgi:DNA-directed RNA polymerase alpha subunit
MQPEQIVVGSEIHVGADKCIVHNVNMVNEDEYIFTLKDEQNILHLLTFQHGDFCFLTKYYQLVEVIFDRKEYSSFFFKIKEDISSQEIKEFRDMVQETCKGIGDNFYIVEAKN